MTWLVRSDRGYFVGCDEWSGRRKRAYRYETRDDAREALSSMPPYTGARVVRVVPRRPRLPPFLEPEMTVTVELRREDRAWLGQIEATSAQVVVIVNGHRLTGATKRWAMQWGNCSVGVR